MNFITKSKGIHKKSFIVLVIIAFFIAMSLLVYAQTSASASKQSSITVKAGEIWEVAETTSLNSLTVFDGGIITVPDRYSLTMTVDGVETGQKLVTTAGVDTQITPGIYRGDVVLTVTEANIVPYQGLNFPLRQALYLDETGVVNAKSVLAAVDGKKPTSFNIDDVSIKSTGECFNGVYVAGGDYTLKNVKINLIGNGRCDLIGYGAAIVAAGADTRLVVDGADISNIGVVRTGVVADGGSNVIIKNSTIKTMDGVLPEDYTPSTDLAQMRGGFPVGGSTGNCRATNLLGTNTQASYINSSISAQGWGVLSSDGCTTPKLTAINSRVSITGNIGGYGTYAIGNATERFLGCELNIDFDVSTLKGGFLFYGDSDPQTVAQLNKDLNLGLTDKELKSIENQNTVINSKRFGIMCTGSGTVDISGGTIFNTGETLFLNKGQTVAITVDGSKGAKLNARNGVVMQVMDGDDPGPGGNPYIEPTTAPEKDESWDLTSTDNAATAIFSNIKLEGDFYNSFGWTKNASSGGFGSPGGGPGGAGGGMPSGGPGGSAGGAGVGMPQGGMPDGAPGGGMPGGPGGTGGGMSGGGGSSGKNMALTFDNATITGVISASEAHHLKKELYVNEQDYRLFGVVTNTPHEAINNGVIISLKNGSDWTVTGTSYLTSLTVESGSTIAAPTGYKVSMTVDGVEKTISPGEYKGHIVLTVNKAV